MKPLLWSPSQVKGFQAEETVCEFLRSQGVEILTRNFRKRFGEIDIVAKEGATICFVEVRSSKRKSGYVRYSVGFQKQFRLRNVIAAYLRSAKKPMSGLSGSSVRFDVAWVCGLEVEYWKNVELAVQSKT